jgi:cell division septation protein DedD
MRHAALIGALLMALALDGCALPPIVAIASYSADIVSYAATGKTVTDHAYSAVARSDCSFIRVLREKPICVDEPNGKTKDVMTAAGAGSVPAPASGAATAKPVRTRYVAIGSFVDAANAERSVTRYAGFHPMMLAVTVHGRSFHRVVAGPLSADEAAALQEKIVAAASPLRHVARG